MPLHCLVNTAARWGRTARRPRAEAGGALVPPGPPQPHPPQIPLPHHLPSYRPDTGHRRHRRRTARDFSAGQPQSGLPSPDRQAHPRKAARFHHHRDPAGNLAVLRASRRRPHYGLKRGATYTGTLSVTADNVTIRNYGTGLYPVLSRSSEGNVISVTGSNDHIANLRLIGQANRRCPAAARPRPPAMRSASTSKAATTRSTP